jgi:hypothetical protein
MNISHCIDFGTNYDLGVLPMLIQVRVYTIYQKRVGIEARGEE